MQDSLSRLPRRLWLLSFFASSVYPAIHGGVTNIHVLCLFGTGYYCRCFGFHLCVPVSLQLAIMSETLWPECMHTVALYAPTKFSAAPAQLSSLICSIEDQFARVLPIEERTPLRTPGPEWWPHWAAYNARIGCEAPVGPSATDANAAAVVALLQYAVMVEYEEHSEAINDSMAASVPITASGQESTCTAAGLREAMPLVSQLCEVLQLPPASSATEPEVARALHSCARRLRIRARADARSESASEAGDVAAASSMPSGLQLSSEALERAAAVLRALYVDDMRELQHIVNDVLAAVQEYTADPKTNAALGQVGR